MKKLLFFLCCIVLGITSYQSIKEFEMIQFQSFNQNLTKDSYIFEIEEGNSSLSNKENYQILQNFSEKNKTNIQRISYENDQFNQEVTVYYVALGNANAYFENIKLHSGTVIGDHIDQFMSSVQTADANQVGMIDLFYNKYSIEIRPLLYAANIKDVRGIYTVPDKESWTLLKKELSQNDISATFSVRTSEEFFSEYRYSYIMYQTIIILCLLIGLSIAYDLINQYKTIAIKSLFGNTIFERGVYILKRYIPLVIVSYFVVGITLLIFLYFYNQYHQFIPFLSFWLSKVSLIAIFIIFLLIVNWILVLFIKISHMIKNKKPVKPAFAITIIVRIGIALLLMTNLQQSIVSYLSVNKLVSKDDQWSLLKDYGYLGVVKSTEGDNISFFNSKTEEMQFEEMFEELNTYGALYVQPSSYYMDESEEWIVQNSLEEQYIEVNTNYLRINKIKDIESNDVTKNSSIDDNGLLNLLIPIELKSSENEIKRFMLSKYESIFKDELTLEKINCIYVEDNQIYFTFSTYYAQSNDYEIENPIAIVINQNLEPEALAHNLSTGSSYYFKIQNSKSPLKEMENFLEKYHMERIWSPVSVAYSTIENDLQDKKTEFRYSMINTVISMILIIVLQIFSTASYFEISKEEVTVKRLFGYSIIERHYLYYLVIVSFWSLIYMTCSFLESTPLLPYLIVGNTLMDLMLFTGLLFYKENGMVRKTLLKTI